MNPDSFTAPYPGIRPFETREHPLFYGRGKHIVDMVKRLRSGHFLPVIGASGCGKSSLVKAGLLPALERGYLGSSDEVWHFLVMQPAGAPFRHLAEAILSESNSTEAREQTRTALRQGRFGLLNSLPKEWLTGPQRVLILVDQFEEIFRFDPRYSSDTARGDPKRRIRTHDTAAAFVDLLIATMERQHPHVFVALTMRSDFLGLCDGFPKLPEWINRQLFLPPQMSHGDLMDAIERPILQPQFGGHIDPRLANEMLNAVGNRPDQLPLIQHALLHLWNSSPDGCITYSSVEPLITRAGEKADNWVIQILVDQLDSIYQSLGIDGAPETQRSEQQRICCHLLCCLCSTHSTRRPTRRITSIEEVASVAGVTPEQVQEVLALFTRLKQSFLRTWPSEDESTVRIDVTHESLIRNWPRVSTWLREDQEAFERYRSLAHTVNDRSELRGNSLSAAREWKEREPRTLQWVKKHSSPDVSEKALEFDLNRVSELIRTSSRQENRRRIVSWAAVVLIFVIAIDFSNVQIRKHNQKLSGEIENASTASNELFIASNELFSTSNELRLSNTSNEFLRFITTEQYFNSSNRLRTLTNDIIILSNKLAEQERLITKQERLINANERLINAPEEIGDLKEISELRSNSVASSRLSELVTLANNQIYETARQRFSGIVNEVSSPNTLISLAVLKWIITQRGFTDSDRAPSHPTMKLTSAVIAADISSDGTMAACILTNGNLQVVDFSHGSARPPLQIWSSENLLSAEYERVLDLNRKLQAAKKDRSDYDRIRSSTGIPGKNSTFSLFISAKRKEIAKLEKDLEEAMQKAGVTSVFPTDISPTKQEIRSHWFRKSKIRFDPDGKKINASFLGTNTTYSPPFKEPGAPRYGIPDLRHLAVGKEESLSLGNHGTNIFTDFRKTRWHQTNYASYLTAIFPPEKQAAAILMTTNGLIHNFSKSSNSIWHCTNTNALTNFPLRAHAVFSADATKIAAIGPSGPLQIYTVTNSGWVEKTYNDIRIDAVAMDFFPDNGHFALIDREGNLNVYDLHFGIRLFSFRLPIASSGSYSQAPTLRCAKSVEDDIIIFVAGNSIDSLAPPSEGRLMRYVIPRIPDQD